MEMNLGEVLDRYSIILLKVERISDEENKRELKALEEAIQEFKDKGVNVKDEWINDLKDANSKIWNLEFDIRRGKEGELGLEEVGRRAIAIRNINSVRVAIKNKIIEETAIGFRDIKKDHVSAKE